MRELKVIACWIASWGAGLGTFWILQGMATGPEDDRLSWIMLVVVIVSLGMAAAAWQAVAKWWPE